MCGLSKLFFSSLDFSLFLCFHPLLWGHLNLSRLQCLSMHLCCCHRWRWIASHCRIKIWLIDISLNLVQVLIKLYAHRVFKVWLFLFLSIFIYIFNLVSSLYWPSDSRLSFLIEIGFTLIKQSLSIMLDEICHLLCHKRKLQELRGGWTICRILLQTHCYEVLNFFTISIRDRSRFVLHNLEYKPKQVISLKRLL